ncbi:alpha-2-macroglobulin [Leptospira wolffii]|uniref:Alpha-2-macroglobulin n=1 Tax=Leptospira wolffii TaxID=409998 RepID=A0ABV5BPY2_9LEPT
MRFSFLRFFPLFIFCFFLTSVSGQGGKVQFSFSPQGEIKKVGQVQVLFREPMVPLGDPKKAVSPFTIDCPVQGEERWVTETDWVYEFSSPLEGGVSCKFTTKAIRSLAGNALTPGVAYSFHTGGPLVSRMAPYYYSPISEDQIFVLEFDTEPKLSDVSEKIWFALEGLGNKIPVRLLQGKDREKILNISGFDTGSKKTIVFASRQIFPANSKLRLIVEKGFRSASGVASSSDWAQNFDVRAAFTASLNCERVQANSGCTPVSPVNVQFSAPVSKVWKNQIHLKTTDGKVIPVAKNQSDSEEENSFYSLSFASPLPPNAELQLVLPKGIVDDMGRPLQNFASFPLPFKTEDFPPLAKFSSDFGVLEKFPEALLPVTVRNIEAPVFAQHLNPLSPEGEGELIHEQWGKLSSKGKEFLGNVFGKDEEKKPSGGKPLQAQSIVIGPSDVKNLMHWYRKGREYDHEKSVFESLDQKKLKFGIPSPNGQKRFEVIGIPLKKSGLHIVEIESPILGESLHENKKPYYVRTAALVTNLSLHFKWGKSSSLVWATSLDKGLPTEGAEIGIYDCNANLIYQGTTDSSGLFSFSNKNNGAEDKTCSNSPFYSGLFLVGKKGDDFTFLHSSWQDGIETWRYNLSGGSYDGDYRYKTVLDRPLFREGETVHMNHIVRKTDPFGFKYPKNPEIPTAVIVQHEASGQKYEIPVRWSSSFTGETEFPIPKDVILGEYSVYLKLPQDRTVQSGRFTVAQFRLPLLKGELQADSAKLVSPKEVPISGSISYLSGGKAGLLPITLRSSLRNIGGAKFASYPEFEFSNGTAVSAFSRYDYGDVEEGTAASSRQEFGQIKTKTDENGFLSEKVSIPRKLDGVHSLEMEMEWKDPNGEIQTVGRSFRLLPSSYLVAIQNDGWVAVKNKIRSKVIVVDSSGSPVPGKSVKVKGWGVRYISHRKRIVGGYYAYDHRLEKKDLGEVCSGSTDSLGRLDCQGAVSQAGQIYLEARVEGEESYAHTSVWVVNEKDLWFGSTDHDRMDLIPEKKKYEPGDTAKFQVRMPFKAATALVTVEREGVFRSFVRNLSGNEPVVEIPLEKHYGPNVFVSVLAVRGRVEAPKPTALIDLAKPAFRLGFAEIQVGWKPYELDLKVSSDKQEYRPREKARVKIKLSETDRANWKGAKITVAAVDESLLELKQNLSWDLLSAMMGPRGLSVRTSTAQMFVVGRRHFGLKSLPPGGGGGQSSTRELFDTLLFWKTDLEPNSDGELDLEIPLNDSLTSFRIVAIGLSGENRFGSASTSIRSSKEILAYASASPFVRESDRIQAGVSLKNTTSKPISIDVSADTNPNLGLQKKNITLGPNASGIVLWDFEVPKNLTSVRYEFQTTADSIGFKDKFVFQQKVEGSVPLQTLQANFYQLKPNAEIPLEEPADAEPNRGRVDVSLTPSLVSGPLEGIKGYMSAYPYDCLEQKLSRAVSLNDPGLWKETVGKLPKYLDSDGLLRFFPDSYSYGSVALTSYALLLASEAKWEIPEKPKQAMIGALNRFIDGTLYRSSPLVSTDTMLRKITALEAVSKYGSVESSKIRAVQTDPNRLPVESLISLRNLYRQTNWDSGQRKKLDEVLRSKLRIQGSSYELSGDGSYLWWLLSSRDTASARLLNSIMEDGTWKEETPKLLRGLLNQSTIGKFDLTTANAFASIALRRYGNIFESGEVSGTAKLKLDSQSGQFDWKNKEGTVSFEFPKGKSKLEVKQEGNGEPYAYVKTISAIPLKKPIHSGLRLEKEILDQDGKPKTSFKEGDIVRVRLKIKSEFSISWLVLKDPVPGGATILGSGLGRDSSLLSETVKQNYWDSPSFVERKFEGITAYYEYFFPGETSFEYMYRINSPGKFNLPPTRLEAMYQPEIFSVIPNTDQVVSPTK